jgi:hypothetical protein
MKTLTRFQTSHIKHKSFGDFVCMACHNFVSSETVLSGVHNRNHCPYCLSSRHLDMFTAGDRLSACKSRMQPVALSLKKTCKKYTGANRGEMMLVHVCDGCNKISINRIAADDDSETLLGVFERSRSLVTCMKSLLARNDIIILEPGEGHILRAQLFGFS